ncbi:MAG: hypothetical protein ACLUER_13550 [Odoribacter splanchnicus]
MKTYAEINEKIKKGTAVVLTAEEVSELSRHYHPKKLQKSRRSNHRHFRAMCSSVHLISVIPIPQSGWRRSN